MDCLFVKLDPANVQVLIGCRTTSYLFLNPPGVGLIHVRPYLDRNNGFFRPSPVTKSLIEHRQNTIL